MPVTNDSDRDYLINLIHNYIKLKWFAYKVELIRYNWAVTASKMIDKLWKNDICAMAFYHKVDVLSHWFMISGCKLVVKGDKYNIFSNSCHCLVKYNEKKKDL